MLQEGRWWVFPLPMPTFTLGKTGGEKMINIGASTDLVADIAVDANGNFQVTWKDSGTHTPAKFNSGFAANTHAAIDWNHKNNQSGTKVYGTLPLMNPYQTIRYWRRIA